MDIASNVIANMISSNWACGICEEEGVVWSCNKGPTGPADPADFTLTADPVLEGGSWIIVGTYSGGISVSCRACDDL